jgi:hypothetical protein
MSFAPKKYRRLADGHIFEGVQHVLPPQSFQRDNPISLLGAFVLGLDVNSSVTIENERILDVVHPVTSEWNLRTGMATVEIIDPNTGLHHYVRVNDWVMRHRDDKRGDFLLFVKPDAFDSSWAEINEFDELANLVYDAFPWEGETYQAVAETVATAVIRTGWSRKGRGT